MIIPDWQIIREIKSGYIGVTPFDITCVQPSSLDVKLDTKFLVFPKPEPGEFVGVIDVKEDDGSPSPVEVDDMGLFIMPGEFMLGSTIESFRLPSNIVARIEGKSSLGRLGLAIHATAGFIDPGFEGHITLELTNLNNKPIRIYPWMKIAQISFMQMASASAKPYGFTSIGSKYQGQSGPTPSRYYENFRT